MKRISCVLAALATMAIAAPAVAQDKPMMKEGGMHHRMHHKMMTHHAGRLMHHERRMMHHKKMMKREM
jgi:hypothetical protein